MNPSIPEICVYSPSDKGNESKGSDNLSGHDSVRSRSRSRVVSPADGETKDKYAVVSPASRSAEDASEETSTSVGIKISILRNRENGKHSLITKPNIELVKWENTFHSRPGNLSNLTSLRPANRAQIIAINRARTGCITSSAKSLDILRQNLQRSINHDINNIIQKYMSRFFHQAIQNIKKNNGNNSVSEEHVNEICHQILENAKEMYSILENNCGQPKGTQARGAYSVVLSDTENVSEPRMRRYIHKTTKKRKYSDSDNEVAPVMPKLKKWKRRVPLHACIHSTLKMKTDTVKREGPKWDTERLNTNTEFIMGAKANKCLGLGATRGRLYNKHANIFRYSGDQEDKQWLYDHSLMPAVGSRVYLLIANDIRELAESDEYKNCPGVCVDEIVGFTVPESMLAKMRVAMLSLRTDNPQPSHKRQRPALPDTNPTGDNLEVVQTNPKPEDLFQEKEDEPKPSTSLEDLDVFGSELQPQDHSCFSMMCDFEESNPKNLDISPEASDLSSVGLDSPLSAPFDIV